jgi:hypothetical protein
MRSNDLNLKKLKMTESCRGGFYQRMPFPNLHPDQVSPCTVERGSSISPFSQSMNNPKCTAAACTTAQNSECTREPAKKRPPSWHNHMSSILCETTPRAVSRCWLFSYLTPFLYWTLHNLDMYGNPPRWPIGSLEQQCIPRVICHSKA